MQLEQIQTLLDLITDLQGRTSRIATMPPVVTAERIGVLIETVFPTITALLEQEIYEAGLHKLSDAELVLKAFSIGLGDVVGIIGDASLRHFLLEWISTPSSIRLAAYLRVKVIEAIIEVGEEERE